MWLLKVYICLCLQTSGIIGPGEMNKQDKKIDLFHHQAISLAGLES